MLNLPLYFSSPCLQEWNKFRDRLADYVNALLVVSSPCCCCWLHMSVHVPMPLSRMVERAIHNNCTSSLPVDWCVVPSPCHVSRA